VESSFEANERLAGGASTHHPLCPICHKAVVHHVPGCQCLSICHEPLVHQVPGAQCLSICRDPPPRFTRSPGALPAWGWRSSCAMRTSENAPNLRNMRSQEGCLPLMGSKTPGRLQYLTDSAARAWGCNGTWTSENSHPPEDTSGPCFGAVRLGPSEAGGDARASRAATDAGGVDAMVGAGGGCGHRAATRKWPESCRDEPVLGAGGGRRPCAQLGGESGGVAGVPPANGTSGPSPTSSSAEDAAGGEQSAEAVQASASMRAFGGMFDSEQTPSSKAVSAAGSTWLDGPSAFEDAGAGGLVVIGRKAAFATGGRAGSRSAIPRRRPLDANYNYAATAGSRTSGGDAASHSEPFRRRRTTLAEGGFAANSAQSQRGASQGPRSHQLRKLPSAGWPAALSNAENTCIAPWIVAPRGKPQRKRVLKIGISETAVDGDAAVRVSATDGAAMAGSSAAPHRHSHDQAVVAARSMAEISTGGDALACPPSSSSSSELESAIQFPTRAGSGDDIVRGDVEAWEQARTGFPASQTVAFDGAPQGSDSEPQPVLPLARESAPGDTCSSSRRTAALTV
jgi:hypothetical protein